jgi:hypothetical protein
MIINLDNINLILSYTKYYLHGKENYKNVEYLEKTNSFIIEHIDNNQKELHSSMGLSLPFYNNNRDKYIYTLSFYARALNNISIDNKFKIYIGNTSIDWLVIDDKLTNEFKLFKLTTEFYFNDNINIFGLNNPFRIGFVNPVGNMNYEIKDIVFNKGEYINEINDINIKLFYFEPYIPKVNYSVNISYSLNSILSKYNTNKNMIILPTDFILNDYVNIKEHRLKINYNDFLIIFEPPNKIETNNNYMKSFNKMLSTINELNIIFKKKYIYFYELPNGYSQHMWKLEYNFLKNFDGIFSQIAQITDNHKYFWVPCYSYCNVFNENIIPFANKKLLANCPISSGHNKRRTELIKLIASKYDIDIYGKVFIKFKENYIKNKIKNIGERTNATQISNDKLNALKKYKFIIVCENCYSYGYISERVIDIMTIGSIPIYYGNNYNFLFNDNIGIIDGQSFKNIDSMYNYINNIDENTYNKMINANKIFITNYIKYFTWEYIWNFILNKILDETIEAENIINNANNFFEKQTINKTINKTINLEDSEGNYNKFIFP